MTPEIDPIASESREHHSLTLNAIHDLLTQSSEPFINLEIETLAIRREAMDLAETPPHFFTKYTGPFLSLDPFPAEDDWPFPRLNDSPSWNASALAWHLNSWLKSCVWPGRDAQDDKMSYGAFDFDDLSERSSKPHWAVISVWPMRDSDLPHLVALMYTGIDITASPECLLRSEVLVVIQIMRSRLPNQTTRLHSTSPVLLYSVVGMHHVRVIEGFHDAKQIVIRVTKLYDISKPDEELYFELRSWQYGSASEKSTNDSKVTPEGDRIADSIEETSVRGELDETKQEHP
ncbi:hypothetical protein BJX64DRAFT_292182 [Aspergillus heterothallicus]